MKLTLNKIREHSPCQKGWETLLRSKNKTKADDEEFSILDVLESNGLDDALWCLRCVTGYEREIRLFVAWAAGDAVWAASWATVWAAGDAARAAVWDAAREAKKEAFIKMVKECEK